jgi:hypothetical protein
MASSGSFRYAEEIVDLLERLGVKQCTLADDKQVYGRSDINDVPVALLHSSLHDCISDAASRCASLATMRRRG